MNLNLKLDLHMHSTVSDGTDRPEALLELVREAGIQVFSVTDHDAIQAAVLLPPLRRAEDPFFLPGVEFSCKDELGKYHILGYSFDPEDAGIRQAVDRGHRLRLGKLEDRLDYLTRKLGFRFPSAELDRLFRLENPGKPHLGKLMVKLGYAKTKEEAITAFINKATTRGPSYLRPEEAISGILASGGVPVLAHPCYGSGDQLILGDALRDRVLRLRDMGLQGLEAYYSGFSGKLRDQALALAEEYSLYVTAGSDYHGTNKLVRLGDTGLAPQRPWPRGLERFLEEVCGL